MRTRFAPSPTGDLHLGGAYVALASWLLARARDGAFIVRMEDLDLPRVVAGAADRILEDLDWLGLTWDEGPRVGGTSAPYVQSMRAAHYERALQTLQERDFVYPCTCSRSELARTASAPHAGEEPLRYSGRCRASGVSRPFAKAALRCKVPEDDRRIVTFEDAQQGPQQQDVAATAADFVLRRADGVPAYHLAVVVDDLEMGIDLVVRGDDLLPSTARQILLARMLDRAAPAYLHLPVVVGPDGSRLAKRHQSHAHGTTLRDLRHKGVQPEEVLGELACALGVCDDARPISLPLLTERARSLPSARPFRGSRWSVPVRWLSDAPGRSPEEGAHATLGRPKT